MVIDDLHHFGFLNAVHGLTRLIVVNQNHLALGTHRYIRARDDADAETVIVKHDSFTQAACHQVLNSVLQQAFLIKHQHIGLGKV